MLEKYYRINYIIIVLSYYRTAFKCVDRPCVQMPSRVCTVVSRWWTVSSRRRGSSATPFCLVFITDRRPHSTIHRLGPSLSVCRCSHLEQFTSAPHFCTFAACRPVTSEDSSLYLFLSQSHTLYSAYAVTLVSLDTLIVRVSYLLLTYLLAYLCTRLICPIIAAVYVLF